MSTAYEPPLEPHTVRDDQPAGDLMRELSQQTSTLVRLELQLAKAELVTKAKLAGVGGGLLAAAAVLGLALLGALTTAMIAAVALALPVWAAALVVVGFYLIVIAGLGLVGVGALRKALPATPEQTVETVKEDVEWAKTQTRSAKK